MLDNSIITLSSAVIGISITGALLSIRIGHDKNYSKHLLVIFLLFAGITCLPLVTTFIPKYYTFYLPVLLPLLLLLPPTIYRFIALRTTDERPSVFFWRDNILPLSGALVTVGFWLLSSHSREIMLIDGELPSGLWPATLAISTFVLILLWPATSVGYLIATIRQLGSFRTHLKDIYSNTECYELRWIDWLMVFLVTLWISTTAVLINDNFSPESLISLEIIYLFTGFLLLFLIAFIFTSPPNKIQESIDASVYSRNELIDKYARSALSRQHAKRLAERIETAMRDNLLYLDPDLSLLKLSKHISALPNMVSQTLNEVIGSSFYDYVAHWRIEAAKPLILSNNNSILTISLEVGFNSRSTFYKAFKREVAMTPKAYRIVNNNQSI